jgi:Asp/Glu/hydantoin racemase
MSTRIALVHAVAPAMRPIADAFAQLWPAAECVNILDDSLAPDRARSSDLTDDVYRRFDALGDYVAMIGADGLLFTCSAFGKAIERVAGRAAFPVLKPNEAMYEAALSYGKRIGMLVTFEPSVASMTAEFEELVRAREASAELRTVCVPDAMAALGRGEPATHDALLADATARLSGVDVIMLAQFSMAGAEPAVRSRVRVPVLTSPAAAVRKLKARLDGGLAGEARLRAASTDSPSRAG